MMDPLCSEAELDSERIEREDRMVDNRDREKEGVEKRKKRGAKRRIFASHLSPDSWWGWKGGGRGEAIGIHKWTGMLSTGTDCRCIGLDARLSPYAFYGPPDLVSRICSKSRGYRRWAIVDPGRYTEYVLGRYSRPTRSPNSRH